MTAVSTCARPCAAGALRTTPLTPLAEALGARMVAFAGFSMPIQFPTGVIAEHVHTRSAASLFDVSHMGQILVHARSGRIDDGARSLERLMPVDLLSLRPGRQRYALLTTAEGGILDDLMIAHRGDHFLLVVNAARAEQDLAHLQTALADTCTVEPWRDRALIALQGPRAEALLARLAPGVATLRFLDVATLALPDTEAVVARSGYSGEDGFEISLPASQAVALAEALLANGACRLAGLAARDSLRLEAGLCLHGHDIDDSISPVEASLAWSIPSVRRSAGARAGGFPGADRILAELADGPANLRVGLRPEGRSPIREGAPLFAGSEAGPVIGRVTSGGFSPSLEAPIAMAFVPAQCAAPGTTVFAELRGRRVAAQVTPLPFIPHRTKRN